MKTMRDKTTVEQEQLALHSYPPDKGGEGGLLHFLRIYSYPPDKGGEGGLLHFSRIHSYPSDKGTRGSPFFR